MVNVNVQLNKWNPFTRFRGTGEQQSGVPSVAALGKRQELILDKLSALQAKVASIAAKMGVTLEGTVHAATSQLTGRCYWTGEIFTSI